MLTVLLCHIFCDGLIGTGNSSITSKDIFRLCGLVFQSVLCGRDLRVYGLHY